MVPSIPGLQYFPEYLDSETHDRLLAAVDVQPWLMSVDHRVQIYGYNYNHAKRAAFRIGALPSWTTDVSVRLCRDGLLPKVPDQLVVNDYRPGSGIFAGKVVADAARISAQSRSVARHKLGVEDAWNRPASDGVSRVSR